MLLCRDVMRQWHYGLEPTWLQRKTIRLQNKAFLHVVQHANTVTAFLFVSYNVSYNVVNVPRHGHWSFYLIAAHFCCADVLILIN